MAAGCVGTSNGTATYCTYRLGRAVLAYTQTYKCAHPCIQSATHKNIKIHARTHTHSWVEIVDAEHLFYVKKRRRPFFEAHQTCECVSARACVCVFRFDRLFNHRHLLFTYKRVCAPRSVCFTEAPSLYTKPYIFSSIFFVRVVYSVGRIFIKNTSTRRWVAPISLFFAKGNADFVLCESVIAIKVWGSMQRAIEISKSLVLLFIRMNERNRSQPHTSQYAVKSLLIWLSSWFFETKNLIFQSKI